MQHGLVPVGEGHASELDRLLNFVDDLRSRALSDLVRFRDDCGHTAHCRKGLLDHQVYLVELTDRVVEEEQVDHELHEGGGVQRSRANRLTREDQEGGGADCGEGLDDGAGGVVENLGSQSDP